MGLGCVRSLEPLVLSHPLRRTFLLIPLIPSKGQGLLGNDHLCLGDDAAAVLHCCSTGAKHIRDMCSCFTGQRGGRDEGREA